MSKHMRHWGAAYILLTLFLGSWLAQLFTQLAVVKADAAQHHQAFQWGDFWVEFLQSTFENWQSEFLQLLVQGLLLLGPLAYLLWQADQNADKRDVEEINAKLDQLLGRR
jgi:hypothetical protein